MRNIKMKNEFDFTVLEEYLPLQRNRGKHKEQDKKKTIATEYIYMKQECKYIEIPNNFQTSLLQALETPEWSILIPKFTKRKKVTKEYSKFIQFSMTFCSLLLKKENGIRTAFSNDVGTSLSLNDIFNNSIDTKVLNKFVRVLATPYTINNKKHQILLHIRTPEQCTSGNIQYKNTYQLDSFFNSPKVLYTLSAISYIKALEDYANRKLLIACQFPILKMELDNLTKLAYPTREEFIAHLQTKLGLIKKGKIVTSTSMVEPTKKNKKEYVFIEDMLASADAHIYNKFAVPVFGKDYARHYTKYSMVNCYMRELCTYKGSHIEECDVSSMYPIMLLQMYKKHYSPLKSEINVIDEIINAENPRKVLYKYAQIHNIKINESKLKVENLSYYNMKNKKAVNLTIHKIYEGILPEFTRWLSDMKLKTKVANKGCLKHKFVSRLLEHKESEIMDSVLLKCQKEGIFSLGVHDAVHCEAGKGEIVAQMIKDAMLEKEFICNVTITKVETTKTTQDKEMKAEQYEVSAPCQDGLLEYVDRNYTFTPIDSDGAEMPYTLDRATNHWVRNNGYFIDRELEIDVLVRNKRESHIACKRVDYYTEEAYNRILSPNEWGRALHQEEPPLHGSVYTLKDEISGYVASERDSNVIYRYHEETKRWICGDSYFIDENLLVEAIEFNKKYEEELKNGEKYDFSDLIAFVEEHTPTYV